MQDALRNQILTLLDGAPNGLASLRGEVFSSGTSSLAVGRLYVVGLNPGAGASYPTVREHVARWDLEHYSAYTDQCWETHCWNRDCYGFQSRADCQHQRGSSAHQKAVVRMIGRAAPHETARSVFSTNAVFAKSESADTFRAETGLSLRSAFEGCWPVHQLLLSIVRPSVVLSLGYQQDGSAYSFFRRKAHWASASEGEHFVPGRKFASFKWTDMTFKLGTSTLKCLVVGIRHPSYVPDAADCQEFEQLLRSSTHAASQGAA